MEHIPEVQEEAGKHPRISFLCGDIPYGDAALGFEAFSNFPVTHGYTVTGLDQISNDIDLTIKVLQSWLYFGLLAEAFGGPITQFDHNHFINRQNPEAITITTRALPRYIWYWVAMHEHDSRETTLELTTRFDACVRLANVVINDITKSPTFLSSTSSQSWSLPNKILLSIVVLVEYVCNARDHVFKFSHGRTTKLRWHLPILEEMLLKSGWCSGEIAIIRPDTNSTCLYYLGTIERKSMGKNHKNCNEQSGCLANSIEYSQYVTSHTRKCNQGLSCCEFGPSTADLASIIDNGGTPVITVKNHQGNGGLIVSIHECHQSDRYVAISHTWSDGMGNPKGNSLKQCQLQHIQRLVNNLYGNTEDQTPFWMDTLCVPTGKKYAEQTKRAINGMAEIYRLADKVLVVDNSLQYHTGNISTIEIGMRIKYCPWATRIWTLQEGRLARELFFQFNDIPFPANDLTDSAKASHDLMVVSDILEQIGEEQVLVNPSAMRLVRALAQYEPNEGMLAYAKLPLQQDPNEEELRLSALKTLKEYEKEHKLAEIWMPIVLKAGVEQELGEVDDVVRQNCHAHTTICTVNSKSLSSINKFRGWGYTTSLDSINISPSALFVEVCAGFAGRTTSRLEDETICMSLLMRMSPSQVQDIPPLNWRVKKWLQWMNSKVYIKLLARLLGLDIQRLLSTCYEERMRLLLSQVRVFPASIILWNAPRLRFHGFRWAPFSMLHQHLAFRIYFVVAKGEATPYGLQVQLPAIRLRSSLQLDVLESLKLMDRSLRSNVLLKIDLGDDADIKFYSSRKNWEFRLRFGVTSDLSETAGGWLRFVNSGLRDQLAILIDSPLSGAPSETVNTLLVQICGDKHGVILTRHIELIELVSGSAGDNVPSINISGSWTSDEIWCVG